MNKIIVMMSRRESESANHSDGTRYSQTTEGHDFLTVAERSHRMSLIKGTDTKPEMIVRRLIHRMGYRYRLHDKDLPGKPDLVFKSRKKVIFVNGCFWHQHDCGTYRMPKSRIEFWKPKLRRNAQRDKENGAELERLGWDHMTVWECELRDVSTLTERIREFLC